MDHQSNYVAGVPTGFNESESPERAERNSYFKQQIEERQREVEELKKKMKEQKDQPRFKTHSICTDDGLIESAQQQISKLAFKASDAEHAV